MNIRARLAASPRLADVLSPETNSFGVLRFVMATLVLISHSYLYAAGTSEVEPLQSWLGRSLGECAVQVFFILSGVMVAQSLDRRRDVADFLVARVLRIFPALFICVLATAFLLGPAVTSVSRGEYFTSPVLFGYVAKTLTLSSGSAPLPGVFETNAYAGFVNSSLWTLKYEVACYVGLATMGATGLFEQRWRWVVAGGLAVSRRGPFRFLPCQAILQTTVLSKTCATSRFSSSAAFLRTYCVRICRSSVRCCCRCSSVRVLGGHAVC